MLPGAAQSKVRRVTPSVGTMPTLSSPPEARQARIAAELAFRRRVLRGLRLVGFTVLLLLALNYILWLRWRSGVIIASSNSPQTGEVIVVRDLPSSAPFWAAAFGSLFEYHLYRCEYYNYGMTAYLSSQTYSNRGYEISRATIAWRSDGSATVSFSTTPDFICSKGWWSKVQSQ
jgi:hypothetical protein